MPPILTLRARAYGGDRGGGPTPVSLFDPATNAWVAQVVANGGTVSATRETLVNNLIKGLKSDGVWTKLDRLWLHAAENTAQALTDVVADALATAVNAPSFTVDSGYTTTPGTSYIDSNVNPSTAGGLNYTLNSACLFAWETSAPSSTSGIFGIASNAACVFADYSSASNTIYCVNGSNEILAFTGDGTSLYAANRSGSGSEQLYIKGSNVNNGTNASGAVPNGDFITGAGGGTGTIKSSVIGFGGNLSATDHLNLYNRLCDFMGGALADAWARQVVTNGGTVSAARQSLVANLIAGGMRDGWWYKLDRLWLFANENSTAALTDIVADSLATAVNSPTFTTDRGYTGNGSNTYIDSGFNPTTASSPNFTQNAASFFAWNNTSGLVANPWMAGAILDNGDTQLTPGYSVDNKDYWSVNDAGSIGSLTGNLGATGLYLANRTTSTAKTLDLNGTQSTTDASSTTTTFNADFCALRSHNVFGTRQVSAFGFGGLLSSTDRSNIYSRIRAYMTSVGVP